MSYIEFKNINKTYNGVDKVLENLNLSIKEGELVTLLGPSGCGKSTLLRILAGFEEIEEGSIIINGEDVTKLEPGKRGIGMVFQQYSLFPNMNVYDNIAFGLKMNKVPKDEIANKVKSIIDIVDLKGKEFSSVKELSGGQKQRVALARAIINKPKVLLLDEPLSAIDAMLRKNLQKSIKRIQKEMNITTIFVTHDQDEAMLMSDVVHLMNKGKIVQSGTPNDIYTKPNSHFVASFIGNYNIISPEDFKKMTGETTDSCIALRPEVIEYSRGIIEDEKMFVVKGKIKDHNTKGNILSYKIDVDGVEIIFDEFYRSFNIIDNDEEVYIFFEKRNCIKVA